MTDTDIDDVDEADTAEYEAATGATPLDQLSEEESELVAAQMVDQQMRMLLEQTLGNNVAGADQDHLPDYYEIFDWDPNPTTRDYYALALRNPYAFAVTFLPASTSWRDPPDVVDDAEPDGDQDQTDFERDVEDLARRADLWDYCKRVDKLSGIGQYGVLVLEFDDVLPEDPADPLEADEDSGDDVTFNAFAQPATDAEQLLGVKAFSQFSIQQVVLGGPGSGRWGEPLYYDIDLRPESDEDIQVRRMGDTKTEQIGQQTIRVHYSRVVHVHAGEKLDDEFRGIPRQQPVYNNLIGIEKALGSAGELAYRATAWGININIDKDYTLDEDGKSQLREHLHRWQVGLENVLRTHGADEVKSLGGEEIDPSGVIDPNIEAISSQPYMPPQSVLKGNETGERATSEDLKSWYGEIQQRREEKVTPTIVRAVIDRLVALGIITPPENGPRAYSVEWKPLAELSEQEQAEVEQTRTETLELLLALDVGLDRNQRLEYARDGKLPTEVDSAADDVAELEDADAVGANARDVDEITASYQALADGGGEVDDAD